MRRPSRHTYGHARKPAGFLGAGAGILLGSILQSVQPAATAASQNPKTTGERPAEKTVRKFQVDVRLQVSPDADKRRVLLWVETLRGVGVDGVSELPATSALPKEGEKAEPAFQSGGLRRVTVLAAIGPAGNLHIGSEAFRLADRARLDALVKKLQAEGVPGPDPSSPMWGLSQVQFELLQSELKQPANFDLKDQSFDAFLKDVRDRTKLVIKMAPEVKAVDGAATVSATTGQLSLGVGLAYVLGQQGLAFEPRQADNALALFVLPRADSKRPWPVGLTPEQFPGNIAPRLMASARYQTKDTSLDEVLAVLARQLQMDVLLDRDSLVRSHIDPDGLRSTVQITGGTLLSAIRKTLAPLGLKHELRIDEANHPFLWITVGEPTGLVPKAKGK
jgi:hypothetical protein